MSQKEMAFHVRTTLPGVSKSKKPVIVLTNDTKYAQRAVLGASSELRRRLVRFDHPVAPISRGKLWLVVQEIDEQRSEEPKTLSHALIRAGATAKAKSTPILCLAPNLDRWPMEDLRDLARGLQHCSHHALPILFTGFAPPAFQKKNNEHFFYFPDLFEYIFVNRTITQFDD